MISFLSRALRALGRYIPSDLVARKYPVSVKGVIFFGETLILLQNERNEWELPGGKIDPGESPEACLAREIYEELGCEVKVGVPVYAWMYHILQRVRVFVIAYECTLRTASRPEIRLSDEHRSYGWFTRAELAGLELPEGYREAIRRWKNESGDA
jgi:8-oxo-dGTP pyrophosphatase MutT (NUDIX family)